MFKSPIKRRSKVHFMLCEHIYFSKLLFEYKKESLINDSDKLMKGMQNLVLTGGCDFESIRDVFADA